MSEEFKVIGKITEKKMMEVRSGPKAGSSFASFTVMELPHNKSRSKLSCFLELEFEKVGEGDVAEMDCVLKDGKYTNVQRITKLDDNDELKLAIEQKRVLEGGLGQTTLDAPKPKDDYQLGVKLGHAQNQALNVILNDKTTYFGSQSKTSKEAYKELSKVFYALNEEIKKDLDR